MSEAATTPHETDRLMAQTCADGVDLGVAFDNSFAREMVGGYIPWLPRPAAHPTLLYFNAAIAEVLGLDATKATSAAGITAFAGSRVPQGAAPLAQAYAGHQFGGFSPRLGDGRAVLLGEVVDRNGERRDIALKGSGRTPFSRGGDGLAAVGPMLRELIVSEAMHHLHIPTTRALAVAGTGERVRREQSLPGAVLTRVAASHLRVGTFQYFAARQEFDMLRQLLNYTIARHDPALAQADNPALALLETVCARQAKLLARWMGVGFIHGVMNTDNMTISGETIDYGPCAFMEAYDPAAVFSSIDHHGRYAYANQPNIAQWNLSRLGEALLPLIHADGDTAVELAIPVIERFASDYQQQWTRVMAAKLGFAADAYNNETVARLAKTLLQLMHDHHVDFTLGFRWLSATLRGDDTQMVALYGANSAAFQEWATSWRAALASAQSDVADAATKMDGVNPITIARNHLVEAALAQASDHDDLAPMNALLAALARPFEERAEDAAFHAPAQPAFTQCYQTFCGT